MITVADGTGASTQAAQLTVQGVKAVQVTLVNAGQGYRTGAVLELPGGTFTTPVRIRVEAATRFSSGGSDGFTVMVDGGFKAPAGKPPTGAAT